MIAQLLQIIAFSSLAAPVLAYHVAHPSAYLAPCPSTCTKVHVVVPDDDLSIIASLNMIDLNDFIDLNPQITNIDLIYPNQQICVSNDPCAVFYTVVKGNTLSGIADETGITLTQLLRMNPLKIANPDLVQVGEKICTTLGIDY